MSEPSNLIPNLNEIMEEYAKDVGEAIQEVQLGAVQEEESRIDIEQEKERGEMRKLELRKGKKK